MKWSISGRSRRAAAALVLGGLLVGGSCAAPSAEAPVSAPVGPGRAAQPDAARAADAKAKARAGDAKAAAAKARKVAAAARRWGLDAPPVAAPEPPAARPGLVAGPGVKVFDGLPPVVFRVPTQDKVVFLTIDDGAEKDPKFSRMMRELDVPFSAFLTGDVARTDYGYFRDLVERGNAMHNHTLNHPDLRTLDYGRQRFEICRQQDELGRELGTRPRLFRPPYGEYNQDSLRAAASCGITAFALWNEEVFPDRMEYRYEHRLKPGDIILTHFRGPQNWNGRMTDMVRRVVDIATAQGFAIARLEDYL